MEAEDTQPRIMKTDEKKPRFKRFSRRTWIIVVAVVAVIVLLAVLIPYVNRKAHESRSTKLINTVHTVGDGKHTCTDGMKQLGNIGPNLTKAGYYSTAAREAGLNYVMVCTFEAGKTSQAINYATTLHHLYVQDGSKNALKDAQLEQFVSYMKSYGH